MRLTLGRCLITPGANDRLTPARTMQILDRHSAADWGELDDEDKTANDRAAAGDERVLSCYAIDPDQPTSGDNCVWIITEADRSATTILLPDEY